MRIIGGKFKGIALALLGKGDANAHLRPTTDRVRESLFNMLEHGNYPPISGARVLDLFAGTGALGLEALSRGAEYVKFVDNGAKASSLISENIGKLRVEEFTSQSRKSALRLGQNLDAPYELVFLDPPYGKKMGEKALGTAIDGGWFAKKALIVWEESADLILPPNFNKLDSRRYGDTNITILLAP